MKMSIKKMQKLKKMLLEDEEVRTHFDMGMYIRDNKDCGTVCCIAGWWAVKEMGIKTGAQLVKKAFKADCHISEFISRDLGLDKYTGRALFLPDGIIMSATPDQAAQAVQNAIDGASDPWADVD